ncbi:GNAT family N-acetyltransferase [Natronosalvus halobius]|uniref:GNAT family N-acetyltransferase n=1 Tax=Natronosalvus halobius TaxID=2953746 RepID=UPI0020A1A6AA|nr:N-acetyltransferase [Natronosalvus halobius]USZ71733.1 GNAT family N-acetyltransferase [Natronosalvus halobius]
MSVNIDSRVVEPGNDEFVDSAWDLKEVISRDEGVLKQRRNFFVDAYRRSTVHCYVRNGTDLVGFAAVRRDGYILFLAVSPDCRGKGIGKRLVAQVAEDHRSITCHARTTNENALQFYEHLGFEIKRRIDNYYEDGGDAYYLKLGSSAGLSDRISELIRR